MPSLNAWSLGGRSGPYHPGVEWISIAISVGALLMSGYALRRAIHADTQRNTGREALGAAIDAGNQLLADYRARTHDREERQRRYEAWEQVADAAVRKADAAQIGRYHAEIPGAPSLGQVIVERIRRLQEILDGL